MRDEREGRVWGSSCGECKGGSIVRQGYRLVIVDKDGVLVSEFQLTENALAQPEAFVAGIKAAIDDIEEDES